MDQDEKFKQICEVFRTIEKEYEDTKALNRKSIDEFFVELRKLENGEAAVKEFTWHFGLDESETHLVESKECRKVFLIDFRKCWRFLNNFMNAQK